MTQRMSSGLSFACDNLASDTAPLTTQEPLPRSALRLAGSPPRPPQGRHAALRVGFRQPQLPIRHEIGALVEIRQRQRVKTARPVEHPQP